jgi:NADH:ubiquinone oxidoreductase subunit 6 (subunit J)
MRSFLNYINYSGILLFLFVFLGILFLLVGLCLLLTESSVHGLLYLMTAFVLLTEVAILCKLEFLGLIFVIVYIGAVCVLMLFHIKLIKTFVHRFENFQESWLFLPFTIIIFLIPILQIITLLYECYEAQKARMAYDNYIRFRTSYRESLDNGYSATDAFYTNYTEWCRYIDSDNTTKLLGYLIYDFHFIYLIIGGFLLLVAMIGSIFLTLDARKEKKFQKLDKQIFTNISKSVFFWKKKK